MVVVYRPPPSTANGMSVAQFFNEFSTFIGHLVVLPVDILIMGDFNFHIDDITDHNANDFMACGYTLRTQPVHTKCVKKTFVTRKFASELNMN